LDPVCAVADSTNDAIPNSGAKSRSAGTRQVLRRATDFPDTP
jgi:hypothetical protein